MSVTPMRWSDGELRLLDQTLLPREEVWLSLRDHHQVAEAIREMRVRGAPAIGIAGAYGLALAALRSDAEDGELLLSELRTASEELTATRPTAVNLSWALERVLGKAESASEAKSMRSIVVEEAMRIHAEDIAANRKLGEAGAQLVPEGATVLTHCNAGSLATGGYGTALGVVRAAVERGKRPTVVATETRPRLQGARLTAWELARDGIDCTLIVDGAAAATMRRGGVDLVVVGADRIAANGDTANKIGTYALAVLAREHGLPFYVAAPTSTLELSRATGDGIPIEYRSSDEVTAVGGTPVAADGVAVENPAFDITPSRLIDAIITERGVARKPYEESLGALLARTEASV